MTQATNHPLIHAGLLAVSVAMEKLGIGKDRTTAAAGKYKYRGIDDALNAMCRPLVDAKITVAPSYELVSREEVTTKEGKGYVSTVKGTLTFYAVDGSSRVAGPFLGTAFDTMDKDTSKAQSIAYRVGMFLTFVIPLGPGMDTEEDDHQLGDGKQKPAEQAKAADPELPRGIFGLSKSQHAWLLNKAGAAGIEDDDGLIAKFGRIDLDNVREVAAQLDAM